MPNNDTQRIDALVTELQKYHQKRIEELTFYRRMRDRQPEVSVDLDPEITGMEKWVVGSAQRAYFDWCVSKLANLPFLWATKFTVTGVEEEAQEALEYLCYGWDGQMDERRMQSGEDPWRFELATQICLGSYAWFTHLVKPSKGADPYAWCEFWDPAQTYWRSAQGRMRVVIRDYVPTLGEAEAHARAYGGKATPKMLGEGSNRKEKQETDPVNARDVWELRVEGTDKKPLIRVWNGYMVDGEMAVEMAPTKWAEIPIMCGSVASYGSESYQVTSGAQTQVQLFNAVGQSVLAPGRGAFIAENTTATLARERMEMVVYPDYVSKTRGAQPPATREQMKAGGTKVIGLESSDPNASFGPMPLPSAPFDVQAEYARAKDDRQLATVPDSIISGSNDPKYDSALLGADLLDRAKTRLGRQLIVFNAAAERGMNQLADQFVREKMSVRLSGENRNKDMSSARFYQMQISYAELPEFRVIKAQHEIDRPIDELTKLQAIERKKAMGLISNLQAQQDSGVKDPFAQEERKLKEQLEAMPFVVLQKLIATARKDMLDKRAKATSAERAARDAAPEDRPRLQAAAVAARMDADISEKALNTLEASMSGGQATQEAQGSVGRQAPQPNATIPNPSPAEQPSQARGEGPQDRMAPLMKGRNGGS